MNKKKSFLYYYNFKAIFSYLTDGVIQNSNFFVNNNSIFIIRNNYKINSF